MAGVEYKPMENAGKSSEPPVVKNAGMEKMLILSRCPYKIIFFYKHKETGRTVWNDWKLGRNSFLVTTKLEPVYFL